MLSTDKLQIAIGSNNPAKIKAVKMGFEILFPKSKFEFYPVSVDSGAGVQPFGFECTIQGAITRARNAFLYKWGNSNNNLNCYGVGIEAGMIPVPLTKTGYLDYQFCAIYYPDGQISIGSGPGFEYPKKVVTMLLEDPSHQEIGTIIDKLSGIANMKEHDGAIGYLSKNVFRRADILQFSVISALLQLKSPEIYSE